MKKLLIAAFILASFSVSATSYDGVVPKEREAKAQAAAEIARIYGYRCDTISEFRPFFSGHGYILKCNRYKYTYEIEDKGRGFVVTAK